MVKPVLIRIDVDSVEGMRNGVTHYIETLNKLGFKASFFVPFGPNNILTASIGRIWRPSFWKQAYYMKPWKTYRLFDENYDKAIEIGKGHPEIVKYMWEQGFEVALHGYDHAYISNNAYSMTADSYRHQMRLASDAYEEILGTSPAGTGTPAWRYTEEIARVQDSMNFQYASDLVGTGPCLTRLGSYVSPTIQIPINIDNVFPLVVWFKGNHKKVVEYLKKQILNRDDYICLTIHTEYEFVHFKDEMTELFEFMAENGLTGMRYDHFSGILDDTKLPVKDVGYYTYNGAVGPVASTEPINGLLN